jgi:hypothetical protein
VRVPFVRALALAGHTGNPVRTPLAGMVQGGVMMAFLALFVWFTVKVALYRRRAAAIA